MVTRLRWTMSVESASVTLTSYRSKNTRKSLATLEKGLVLLKSGKHSKLGDEGKPIPRIVLLNLHLLFFSEWAFLEQLALAAIDLGKLKVADVCFPLSRVV